MGCVDVSCADEAEVSSIGAKSNSVGVSCVGVVGGSVFIVGVLVICFLGVSVWSQGYLGLRGVTIFRRDCIEVSLCLGETIGLACSVESVIDMSGGDVVACGEGVVTCVVSVGVVACDDCVDVTCVDGAGVTCVGGESCVDGVGVPCVGGKEGSVLVVDESFVFCAGIWREDAVSFGCWVGGSGVVFFGFTVRVGIVFCSRVSTTDCIVGDRNCNVWSSDKSEMLKLSMSKCFFMFSLRIEWYVSV